MRGRMRPAVGVTLDYELRPLAIHDANGDVRAAVIDHVLTTHTGGSLVLFERVRLGLDVPVILYTTGDRGTLRGVTYDPPRHEQAMGDVRLGADFRLVGRADSPLTVGLGAQLFVPTGDASSYAGDGAVRVAPRALVAGTVGSLVYAAKLGVMIRSPQDSTFADSPIGHQLTYGASGGIAVIDKRATIGPEIFGSTVLTAATFKTRTSPLEVLLGGHYACECGFRGGLGVGTGLTSGYGAPDLRVVGSLEWSPTVVLDEDGDGILDADDACRSTRGVASSDPLTNGCPPPPRAPDEDGDGIPNSEDACMDAQGPGTTDRRTNGCPDKDGDGIADPLDACPFEAGPPSEDAKKNGCPEKVVPPPPPDHDHDGVPDDEDQCPDVPGRIASDLTNGCPAIDLDRDKDEIPNELDACPDDAGPADPEPARNGCPNAFLKGTQIRLLDQPQWKPGKPELAASAANEEIMLAIRKVVADHPDLAMIRIEGHTDNQGKLAWNRELSLNRARVMMKWLVDHGANRSKLRAVGLGPDQPIMPNTTADGRKANGRMELHVEQPAPAPVGSAPGNP